MNKYQSYKQSGIEWVGEIPTHWKKIKVKHLVDGSKYYQIGDGDHGSIKPEMYQEQGVPYIRVQNLSWDGTLHRKGLVYISEEIHRNNLKSKLIPGDLLVCKTGNTIGKIGILTEEFGESNTTSSIGKITIDNKKYITEFVKYIFQSNIIQRQIWETGEEKSCQPGFNNNQLTEFFLFTSPISEQLQIVKFLDEKTELIDKLISTKDRKITLLKEKRTSLINKVVTKGLNDNVKMKDSGVKWIGEISQSWNFIPMKYFTIRKNGIQTGPFGTQLNTKDYTESGVKVLNQKTLINDEYILGEEFISYEKFQDLKGFNVMEGDLIMGTRGSFGTSNRTTFGKVSEVPSGLGDCVLHPCLIRIRLNDNLVDKTYFKYYINDSTLFLDQIRNTSNSTTIEVIYGVTLKDIKIPIPSKNEQLQIVDYLDLKTKEIDDLVLLEQKKIDLLKEYRQSLISEVVTGKIKVTK
jgi:type I restriction enzyme S subunit